MSIEDHRKRLDQHQKWLERHDSEVYSLQLESKAQAVVQDTLVKDTKAQTVMLTRIDDAMGLAPNPLGKTSDERAGHGVLAFVARSDQNRAFAAKTMAITKALVYVISTIGAATLAVLSFLHYLGKI